MNERNVEKLKSLGFKQLGYNLLGKINGYFFDVCILSDVENQYSITFTYSANTGKSNLVKYLDKLEEDGIIAKYEMSENHIIITCIESLESDIEDLISKLAEKLEKAEFIGKCDNCNNSQDLNYYTNGKFYLLLCKNCADKTITQFESEKHSDPHYVMGFIGSLIGALLGSVLWIIIGSIGFIASIAGVAIAYCAFKGYEKMKGKLTTTGIGLNIAAIIIAFLFAEYAGLYIDLTKEYGISIMQFIMVTPELFASKDVILSLLPDLGFGILFAFLGVRRTISENLAKAKALENMKIEKIDL